jgi:hypothetical protein
MVTHGKKDAVLWIQLDTFIHCRKKTIHSHSHTTNRNTMNLQRATVRRPTFILGGSKLSLSRTCCSYYKFTRTGRSIIAGWQHGSSAYAPPWKCQCEGPWDSRCTHPSTGGNIWVPSNTGGVFASSLCELSDGRAFKSSVNHRVKAVLVESGDDDDSNLDDDDRLLKVERPGSHCCRCNGIPVIGYYCF